jgi:hypothetical protein
MAFIVTESETVNLHAGDVVIWDADDWDDILEILVDHAEKYMAEEGPWDYEKVLNCLESAV